MAIRKRKPYQLPKEFKKVKSFIAYERVYVIAKIKAKSAGPKLKAFVFDKGMAFPYWIMDLPC